MSTTFDAEVRALAAIDHPNVVPIHDHGRDGDRRWVTMGRAATSLAEVPPSSWHEVRDAARSVLAALAHLHARGLTHRDVKPSNVLRTQAGVIWLADLGLAADASGTGTAGTPAYMSPESSRGVPAAASDLYALGCTVWAWVCGTPTRTTTRPPRPTSATS
ncbi:MAG: serine/threonine protein kinase [Myxococcales bacterium]|nr:serine/threonine protein kinase [Myxococcales bacterium]